MLYIYNGNDPKIKKGSPLTLPKRALADDGFHYGGLADRTESNLEDLGFTPAPEKQEYDPETERVVWRDGAWAVENLPEPPAPEPRPISQIEFIALAQEVGGMTDEQLVASKGDDRLAAMWIKFDIAPLLSITTPDVQAGIAGLDALGYLPEGKDAVLAAWPV